MSLNNTFMELAEKFAENSTCLKRQVGAVLVKDEMIISYGYNRTLIGITPCNQVFRMHIPETGEINFNHGQIPIDGFNYERTTHHDFSEKYEITAVQDCLSAAARNIVSTAGATIYVTTAPSVDCAKLIIASDIKTVMFKDIYKDTIGLELLEELNIDLHQYKDDDDGKGFYTWHSDKYMKRYL